MRLNYDLVNSIYRYLPVLPANRLWAFPCMVAALLWRLGLSASLEHRGFAKEEPLVSCRRTEEL